MSHIQSQADSGKLDSLKLSDDYSFDSTAKLVTVNNTDIKSIVSVFNVTTGSTVFIAGNETYTGTMFRKEITFDVSSSGMSNTDELYILYSPILDIDLGSQLDIIIEKLDTTNEILNNIYNPQ